jgi:hypothetical protein
VEERRLGTHPSSGTKGRDERRGNGKTHTDAQPPAAARSWLLPTKVPLMTKFAVSTSWPPTAQPACSAYTDDYVRAKRTSSTEIRVSIRTGCHGRS